jgi:hypothetical protein
MTAIVKGEQGKAILNFEKFRIPKTADTIPSEEDVKFLEKLNMAKARRKQK